MITAREFNSAADLKLHYRNLGRKFWAHPGPVQIPSAPVELPTPPKVTVLPPPLEVFEVKAGPVGRISRFNLIVAKVSQRTRVQRVDIMGRSRFAPTTAARQRAVVSVAMAMPNLSLPQVAALFDMDHTTCLHALRKAGMHDRWKARRATAG